MYYNKNLVYIIIIIIKNYYFNSTPSEIDSWLRHCQKQQGLKNVMKQVWKVKTRRRDPWEELKEKITKSQHALSHWRKVSADPTKQLIQQKAKLLGDLQGEGNESHMETIHQIQSEVNDLIEIEDLKWWQRAKESWLQYGNKNSKYLHACVNQQRKT